MPLIACTCGKVVRSTIYARHITTPTHFRRLRIKPRLSRNKEPLCAYKYEKIV